MKAPDLILGTVQLGMPYGIAGPREGVSRDEALAILRHAHARGIRCLDTAAGYGESEQRIGESLGEAEDLRVITKLCALDASSPRSPEEQVRASVQASLERLHRQHLDVVLVHRPGDLLGDSGESVWRTLQVLREEGHIGQIGVSVYRGAEIDALLSRYSLEVIQLPLNLLDQRLLASGYLDRLNERGVTVHLRSLFLQGLLLLDGPLPDHFAPLRPVLTRLREELDRRGLRPLEAALGFARALPQADGVVIGVDSIAQLDEILACWHKAQEVELDWTDYAIDDERLLDPSYWPARENLHATANG